MAKPSFDITWQKNLRRIPPVLLKKIEGSSDPKVVVTCVKKVSLAEVQNNEYVHLQLKAADGRLQHPPAVLPKPGVGHYSKRNAQGYDIVHTDKPKVSAPHFMEAPDWQGYGTHTVTMWRDVYQRTHVPPKAVPIEMQLLSMEALDQSVFAVRFTVAEVLDRGSKGFENHLLFNLNLLQENVGKVDIFPASAGLNDYLSSLYQQVGWEILPPGERDQTLRIIVSHIRNPSEQVQRTIGQRYDLLAKLKPQAFIHGTGGFERYFGAKFADDLVVFENMEYGNAIYVMYDNWAAVSQKSRTELLEAKQDRFDRIIHRSGWQNELAALLRKKLKGKQPN